MEASSESESEAGPGTQRPGTGTVSAAVHEHLRKLFVQFYDLFRFESLASIGGCVTPGEIPSLPLQNKSRFLPQTWRTWRELVSREEDVVSPGEETVEALLGLVRSPHSPWALLNDSNAEDRFLRELAIRNPMMIRDTFFYSYFRSLRVVDKEVTLVDKDLLKFLKLEELVLSANRIKEVEAANLPPTLKVLELYGNEISSMECLCAHPPPRLQHLGLGHNKLLGPSESLPITADHCPLASWGPPQSDFEMPPPASRPPSPPASGFLLPAPNVNPMPALSKAPPRWLSPAVPRSLPVVFVQNLLDARSARGSTGATERFGQEEASPVKGGRPNLVSLDLGFNDLMDLQSMLARLRTLRHLRLLVLQGNPLALVPYYRGLTVDSLAQLCVLDDITVSPNEKHLFRGLSLNGDLLAQEAQFVVTIGNVRGVPDTSLLDPEPGPEGPFITYSYYVTYDFVKDEEGEANEYTDVLAEIVKPSSSLELLVEKSPEEVIENVIEDVIEEVTEEVEGSLESEVEEWGESELSVVSVPSTVLPTPRASAEELTKLRPRIDPRLCPSPGVVLPLKEGPMTVLFNTTHKPWAEVIQCNYEMQHVLRNLVPLKAFLLAGTTVTIVEEKQAPKKKKEPLKELRQDPPILQVLGRGLVVLEPLLVGEPLVSSVCNFGVVRTLASDRLAFARDSKKIKKTAKKENPKAVIPIYEGDYHPEPLTVEVQIQLNQCRSAEEALRTFAV
ncbi:Leucine-rich repeat-containing protein 43 [Saguinus oedipus]|uniref:Leucine-rich repeat-containing protein 43 n=1 Tax=Saguinus oedipus TaxID=9490 RepID=A0ABQ9V0A8_SAGOE|nr:Leucine-rich repeat-containing protein 43 [Saguinus oedipus]